MPSAATTCTARAEQRERSPSMTDQPCHFIIFGATGSLASDKLLPALYALERAGHLPASLRIVALARRPLSLAQWCQHVQQLLQQRDDDPDPALIERYLQRFDYLNGDYGDPGLYQDLSRLLEEQRSNLVFYLAIPPSGFVQVVGHLDANGFSGASPHHRIVVEKPFGTDLDSARRLNRHLHQHFEEDQIYRIDHYLGKETVQNLLVFRFANTLVEPFWNRHYIDHVQITVAESAGIGERAPYYDHAGALRDMLQNHLMQLLSVIAIKPPATLDADALRDEKVKVLRSIRPLSRQAMGSHVCRGQYTEGSVAGRPVPGYLQEPGVAPGSTTETYVAAKFYIDNWRWSGVPFYLRTGKRMAEQSSLIGIRFRHPPRQLFRETPVENIEPNWIVLAIQPHESMHIELHSKQPGLEMNTRTSRLIASYRTEHEPLSDAYETLLLDIIQGDRSLFIRFDEVEWAWRIMDPILHLWSQGPESIHGYPAGSWGPAAADRLFDSAEHQWRNEV